MGDILIIITIKYNVCSFDCNKTLIQKNSIIITVMFCFGVFFLMVSSSGTFQPVEKEKH